MLHVLLMAATAAQSTPAPNPQPLYGCYAHTDCKRKPYVCFAGLAWEPCGPSHPAEYVLVHIGGPDRFKIDGRTYLLSDLDKYFKGLASAKPATQVRIIADPGAQHAAVMRVINAATNAGLETSRVLQLQPLEH